MAYKVLTNCFQHTHPYLQRCVVVSNLSFFTAMALLMVPHDGIAAWVDYYSSGYKDVIGNAPFLGHPISIGGTNNLESHKENVYSSGNAVDILSGSVDNGIYGGYHNGTTTSADIESSNNTVMIGGGFTGHGGLDIYGGYARSENPFSMTASHNTVTIYGGTANDVFGGLASVGSHTGSIIATASGNTVNINNGIINSVYGGYAISSFLPGTHMASGNTINISSGIIGDIYGGAVAAQYGAGQATNNVVTISGSPNLMLSSLYGGGVFQGTSDDVFTGNTLNVKTTGLTVGNIRNFQYLNFYVPSTSSAGDTMLSVLGIADLTDSLGRSSIVNVGINGGSSLLQTGDTITLIDAGALVTNSNLNARASGTGMQGVTLLYNFDITTENNKLLATVSDNTGPTLNEQSKALSEGFVSGLGMVTQGADIAAGQGMDSAVSAAKTGAAGGAPAGFGALSGGSVRYNTGSYVDMHSVSLMVGLAGGADTSVGRLTFAPFFEYGNGSYDTYNSFSGASPVRGDGNTHYFGGGVLGRMDFADTGSGNIHIEASGRAGRLHNEYKSSDLRDAAGHSAEYDSSSMYYGLHLGAGYLWRMAKDASLDLYGKYFWTHQEGDSITLSTGDPIDFKEADSSRLRLGSRFSHIVQESITLYAGAAYEHEFDGEARASTNGYEIKAPSMRGNTGIGELGFIYRPLPSLPLSFDLAIQGYTGKREGATGSLQVKYEF